MTEALEPLPVKLTENRLRAASPAQRAAWLAEAEATAPARAARMRETLAKIDAPKAAHAIAPLPVGADREALTRLYEAWQDAQVAAGRESCDHGQSLARTCLTCYDGRVWESSECAGADAAADAAAEAALSSIPYVAVGDGESWPFEALDHREDETPTMEQAITDISLSLQGAGFPDESEADEEARRLAGIVVAANATEPLGVEALASRVEEIAQEQREAMRALCARDETVMADLAARLEADILAACRREFVTVARADEIAAELRAIGARLLKPVIAPPAIPAHMAAQIAVAEGKAETARKAVEALEKTVKDALAQGDGLYRVLTRGTMSVSEAARAFNDSSKAWASPPGTLTMEQVVGPERAAQIREDARREAAARSVPWVAPARDPEPKALALRSSALPLFASCAASMDLTDVQIRIETTGEPARLGTAVHAAAAIMVRTDTDAARDACDEIAERHGVDRDDLGRLVWLAGEAWREVRGRFPSPVVESELRVTRPGLVLTGHPDIYAIDGRTLRVLDWKSGRVVYDTREQLLGYALLVWSRLVDESDGAPHSIDTIEVSTAWLRDGRIQRIRFTVEEVLSWGRALEQRAQLRPLPYSPGSHCLDCPRRADCPAKAAWVRQAVAEMGTGTPAEALAKARAVAKAAEQAIEAIRGQAIAAGVEGLEVREEQRVTVRLAHSAVPQAVREVLGAEATASGSDVKSALRKVLGLTSDGVEEEMARLVEAGAAKVVTSRKVKEQK